MSPNENNDLLHLLNVLEYIGKIHKYTEKVKSAEELFELNEQMNLNASLTLLANIGESVSKISRNLKIEYPNIEWKRIKDFRNRIVHDYVGIDLAIVYGIITEDLKTIKQAIEKIVSAKIENKVFDIEEIKIAKDSNYYKFIDFENVT